MTEIIHERLEQTKHRLGGKGLFGAQGDSLSLRVPGTSMFILAAAETEATRTVAAPDARSDTERLHGAIYRTRPDTAGVVVGETAWTTPLVAIGSSLPSLFDEQARHLGEACPRIGAGQWSTLEEAIRPGSNALTFGRQRVVLGPTPNRVVLNADLFEKCAKAFVIARSTTEKVRPLPAWALRIWVRRLRADQAEAAKAQRVGRIPEGMDAY